MLYSLQPSTTSGNSGAEQLNKEVSVPVDNLNGGAENPVVIDKNIDNSFNEEVSIEETNEEKIEELVNEEIVEIKKNSEESASYNNEDANLETETIIEEFLQENETINETIQENIEQETEATSEKISNKIELVKECEVDVQEVVCGFESARGVLKVIYEKALNENFKPTLNDATVDLLAYIGARSEYYGKKAEFLKCFGVDTSRFADRYRNNNYLPVAFKISVWVDKNKETNSTIELLNCVLQTLFALNIGKRETEIVKTVKESVIGIIEYLKFEGINSGF